MSNARAACLYLRSSKDRHEVSIDAQRRELTALAAARSLSVVTEYTDAVESGKDEQRPGFQAMLRDLKAARRTWSTILMLDTSRLGRRRYLAQAFKHECRKLGVQIVFAKVPETDPISAVILESVLEAMDEVHSLMSREKGLAGMRENVAQGFRAGGRAPFGYRLVRVATGGVRDGSPVTKSRLEPDGNAPLVAAYLKGRAIGRSGTLLARDLGLELTRTTLVGIEWNALTYAGHTVWNVHDAREEGRYRSGSKRRPREEWLVQRDTHDALITEAEAEAIIRALENGKHRTSRRRRTEYLLSGLLKSPDGTLWHGNDEYYRHGRKNIKAAGVESVILGRLVADLQSDAFVAELLRQAQAASQEGAYTTHVHALRKELAGVEKRLQRLSEALEIGQGVRTVLTAIDALERERDGLARRIDEVEIEARRARQLEEITEVEVRSLLGHLAEDLSQLDREHLKDFLRGFLERVKLDPATMLCSIHYRLPMAGSGDIVASPRLSANSPTFEMPHRAYTKAA